MDFRKIMKYSRQFLNNGLISSCSPIAQYCLPEILRKQWCKHKEILTDHKQPDFWNGKMCANSELKKLNGQMPFGKSTEPYKYSDLNRRHLTVSIEQCGAHPNVFKSISKYSSKIAHQGPGDHKFLNCTCPNSKVRVMNYCTGKDRPEKKRIGRANYNEEIECHINNQISAEFEAAFAYLSMSCYFSRSDISLGGAANFFVKMYLEELGHAMSFIKYQNLRGGTVLLSPINTTEYSDWGCIQKTLEVGLEMEKLVYNKILELINLSQKLNDVCTEQFFARHLEEQVESIREFAALVSHAEKLGSGGAAELTIDRELLSTTGHGVGKKNL